MLSNKKNILLLLTSILASALAYFITPSLQPTTPIMAAIVVFMAMAWIFEFIPIPVTSLLPLILFPLFEIADSKTTAAFYGKDMIFLFLGGLILAKALQVSNLHQRIALNILNIIGTKPSRLVLGFMITTAFLSMWISNTSSVMVMMPIAISIIEQLKSSAKEKHVIKLATAMMLGIAYSADIGGMATLIGTPPNMVFIEMYENYFPDMPTISFAHWMMLGLPLSVVFIFFGWLLLTKIVFRTKRIIIKANNSIIKTELIKLGKLKQDELSAGIVFLMTIILWVTGSDITFSENFKITGWRSAFDLSMIKDANIAIGCAVLLFIIPSKSRNNESLLKWKHIQDLPWGILFLFGGGFALAGGFEFSGLSSVIGNIFNQITIDSPFIVLVIICFVLTFLTEITSNTATTNLILPILAKAAPILNIDPRYLMIPATFSASCAFMMPVASPTQALIFGSGYVKIKDMVRAGIWFNFLGIILISTVFGLLFEFILK